MLLLHVAHRLVAGDGGSLNRTSNKDCPNLLGPAVSDASMYQYLLMCTQHAWGVTTTGWGGDTRGERGRSSRTVSAEMKNLSSIEWQ